MRKRDAAALVERRQALLRTVREQVAAVVGEASPFDDETRSRLRAPHGCGP